MCSITRRPKKFSAGLSHNCHLAASLSCENNFSFWYTSSCQSCGVSQGSVLGPLLLIMYTTPPYSMNTSSFSDQISPNPAITIFDSFAVSVHTSITKQPSPSPFPLFTPCLTTATVFITTCQWRSQDLEVGRHMESGGQKSPSRVQEQNPWKRIRGANCKAPRKLTAYYGYLAAKPCIILCI